MYRLIVTENASRVSHGVPAAVASRVAAMRTTVNRRAALIQEERMLARPMRRVLNRFPKGGRTMSTRGFQWPDREKKD